MAQSLSLQVTGMKCGGCESSVKDKLGSLAGIISVHPSHKDNRVDVEYDEGVIDPATIAQNITDAGFEVH